VRPINENGLKLITSFEGCYLESYPDPASELGQACRRQKIPIYHNAYRRLLNWQSFDGTPWTIGYGRTVNDNGSAIQPGDTISKADALPALLKDVAGEGSHFVDAWVGRAINEDQYAALSSFCFNAGAGTFHRSKILERVNANDFEGAAEAFLPYDTAQGIELSGLARRRRAERALFLSDYKTMQREIDS
jgi:GH24 family phage-related lysozyme (muramidase)